jgi:cardiolipin synthase
VTHLLVSHVSTILGFVMAMLLLATSVAQRRTPGTTFAWLLAVVLVPYVGVPLYLVFGGRKLRQRGGKAKLYTPEPAGAPHDTIASMLCASGAPPPRTGNRFELLGTGEAAFATILETLESATRSIHISTLILGDDEVGDALLDVLGRKAKAGVEVRVLLDSLFKRRAGRRRVVALTEAGGRVAWFMPVWHLPFRRQLRANLRLHRKIILVDGQTAIVGGMNLAHEYMGPTPAPERWRDLSARIHGPAAADLATIFRADWAFAAHEQLAAPTATPPPGGECVLQVVGSGPDVADDLIYDAFLTAVFTARRRLWVATPYFVPDEGLLRALVLAVRRGVDVRVLVPARSNHRTADYAGASYLRALAAAGGQICCYEPSMMHGKVILVDSAVAAIGSANLDMRSLFLNYEVAAFVSSPTELAALDAWFQNQLAHTIPLAPAGRLKLMLESVARLVGPLE